MKYNNNNNKSFKKTTNVLFELPLKVGTDGKGQEYNIDSFFDIVDKVPFEQISIPLWVNRKDIINPDAKGIINIGFITKIDRETKTISGIYFGNKRDITTAIASMIETGAEVYARVSLNRYTDTDEERTVKTIIGFDLIPAE